MPTPARIQMATGLPDFSRRVVCIGRKVSPDGRISMMAKNNFWEPAGFRSF
jgi:hypothetical protein